MKDLIVYYSLEGNTEYAAMKIREKTGAELLRLIPVKAYHDKGFAKFFWGGKSAVMASNYTPPPRTFIENYKEQLKGEHFAAFACQSGMGGEKALAKLARSLEIPGFDQTAVFIDPKSKRSDVSDRKIDNFCGLLADDMVDKI